MSLNLWKIAGKPTSYSSLASGESVNVGIGDFILSYRAKSASGSTLRPYKATDLTNASTILTPDYKSYTYSFSSKSYGQLQLLVTGTNDIIIDSISLVQAPLPKLTINGVDGFQSGKWNLHANATVVDDSTLVLNATGNNQYSSLTINVKPLTQYTLSFGALSNVRVDFVGNTTTIGINYSNNNPITFATNSDTTSIIVYLSNNTTGVGIFTFQRPMLNLGSTPAPYSKKTGDKMVMPTVKKNLISNDSSQWVQGSITGTGADTSATVNLRYGYIPISPNKTYILNANNGYQTYVFQYDSTKTGINQLLGWGTGARTFTTASNASYVRVLCGFSPTLTNITPTEIANILPQLEQGTVATPYEPYAVQVNKKPQKYVPKKNLISISSDCVGTGLSPSAWFNPFGNVSGNSLTSGYPIPITKGDTLTVSGNFLNGTDWQLLNGDGSIFASYLGGSYTKTFPNDTMLYFRVKTDTNGNYELKNFQIEKGSTATPYEPYQLVLPKTKKGLSFNGVTDYLQLPSMTMDAIEIECVIDAVQPGTTPFLFDARNGLTNGYFSATLGSGWDKFYINNVEDTIKTFSNLPRGTRTIFKAVKSSQFTDDVTIFSNNAGTSVNSMKGTLYKVTCYLNGAIVAQYDFENSKNIVGNQVITSAQNLIPSFEDSRWSIHANAKVLGKDVLHLDATGNFQNSYINIPVIPGQTYKFNIQQNGTVILYKDVNMTGSSLGSVTSTSTFTADSSYNGYISVRLTNSVIGSFDFIRPQLYQLSGQEGTINGSPTALNKPVKRQLYAKR